MKLLIELDEEYVKAIDKIRFLVGGRTDRKLQLEIIKAIKNGKPLEQEPTTKNDLRIDAVSREQVLGLKIHAPIAPILYSDNSVHYEDIILVRDVEKLPSVTPQEPKSEWEHDHEILKAYSDGQASIITVLEDIKAEMENLKDNRCFCHHYERGINDCINVLNKHMESEAENGKKKV